MIISVLLDNFDTYTRLRSYGARSIPHSSVDTRKATYRLKHSNVGKIILFILRDINKKEREREKLIAT